MSRPGAASARRWAVAGFAALSTIPVLVALVVIRSTHWYPTGDMAQAELHVRGIWSHLPLVGAAGRITSDTGVQGSHPGPSLWFAMYPVYATFGRTSFGLMAGAASVSIASFAGALWLAARRGTAWLVAVGVLLVVLVRASGPVFFIEPWNPWLAVFPFLVFLLAVWELAEGRWAFAPLAVVAGSHCVQCHTGYLVIVVGLLGAGALWGAWVAWRAGRRRYLLGWAAGAFAAGVVMWILPLIDQLTRHPGNMTILLQNFATPDEPYLPKGVVARATLSQLSLFGPWLTGPALLTRNLPAVLLTGALWAGAIVVAWRRRDPATLTLHGILALGAVLGLFSVERIFGSYLEYTVRWFWVLTGAIVAGSCWTLWRLVLAERLAGQRRRLAVGIVGAAIVCGAVATVQFADRVEISADRDSALVGAVIDQVTEHLDRQGRYLVRWLDPVSLGGMPFGVVDELARRGFHPGVDEQFAAAALPQRVLPEDRADGVVYVVLGERIDAVRADPQVTEIAAADIRTPAEVARAGELADRLRARFAEIGRPDLSDRLSSQYGMAVLLFGVPGLPPDVAADISELIGLRMPVAVFLAAPGTVLPELS